MQGVLLLLLLGVVGAVGGPSGRCPGQLHGTPPSNNASVPSLEEYNNALKGLSVEAVLGDIVHMLTKSQDCWPGGLVTDVEGGDVVWWALRASGVALLGVVPAHRRAGRVRGWAAALPAREQLGGQH
eukprot:Sspe_Gene.51303::Locus_28494_Transcript_1_1_Confidence_1.000_Length_532::g.51303::m.51303